MPPAGLAFLGREPLSAARGRHWFRGAGQPLAPRGSREKALAGLVLSLLLPERLEEASVHTRPLPPGPGASLSLGRGVDRTARPCPFLPGLPRAAKLPEGLALLGSTSWSVSSAGPGGGQGQLASPAGVSQSLVSVPWTGPRPSRGRASSAAHTVGPA